MPLLIAVAKTTLLILELWAVVGTGAGVVPFRHGCRVQVISEVKFIVLLTSLRTDMQ